MVTEVDSGPPKDWALDGSSGGTGSHGGYYHSHGWFYGGQRRLDEGGVPQDLLARSWPALSTPL